MEPQDSRKAVPDSWDGRHFRAYIAIGLVEGLLNSERRVATALIEHHNRKTGRCEPSVERLATLLGMDRATVLRATAKLCDGNAPLFLKNSHGGRQTRASYSPQWQVFDSIVETWREAMRSRPVEVARMRPVNVASVRPNTSHVRDVGSRMRATQTLRINPKNKPKVDVEPRQRYMLHAVPGFRDSPSHQQAADGAAGRRLQNDLQRQSKPIIEAAYRLTEDAWEKAQVAERRTKGAGVAVLLQQLRDGR